MRDMVPHNDRSIRNIPVSGRTRRREPAEEVEDDSVDPLAMREARPMMRRKPNRGRRWFIIAAIVVVIVCAIGGLLLSTLFAGATVTVTPQQQSVTPPPSITGTLNPGAGQLGYEVVTVTRSATTTVNASGIKQVSNSASGVITIFNSSGIDPQRLIANTRFQSPDGKIYRIHDSVTVPGDTKAADGTVTPGSISTTVYADSPGDSYNLTSATRFTIPGFQGDPKYTTVYAQGSSITGGFAGPQPAVADADLAKAGDTLKQSLTQAAQSALTSQIPSGFMAIPGTLQVSFSDLVQSPGDANTATVSQSATMSGSIVDASALASAIARATVSGYNGEAVAFSDLSQISISAATTTQTGANLPITISGTPTLIWQYDPGALKSALVGKSKSQFQTIVDSFAPAIKSAQAKVRPFWEGSFPSDPNKINVVTTGQ